MMNNTRETIEITDERFAQIAKPLDDLLQNYCSDSSEAAMSFQEGNTRMAAFKKGDKRIDYIIEVHSDNLKDWAGYAHFDLEVKLYDCNTNKGLKTLYKWGVVSSDETSKAIAEITREDIKPRLKRAQKKYCF